MSVLEISMLVIAAVNLALLVTVLVLIVRLSSLLALAERMAREQGAPLLDKLNRIAADLGQVSGDVREVGRRFSGTAARVMDEVEPPLRRLGALVAGIRAGVGKMLEWSQHGNGDQPGRPRQGED